MAFWILWLLWGEGGALESFLPYVAIAKLQKVKKKKKKKRDFIKNQSCKKFFKRVKPKKFNLPKIMTCRLAKNE